MVLASGSEASCIHFMLVYDAICLYLILHVYGLFVYVYIYTSLHICHYIYTHIIIYLSLIMYIHNIYIYIS